MKTYLATILYYNATDFDQSMKYITVPNDNFDVEPNTGWIKTKKTLSNSNSFVVRAYAQDTAATGAEQKSPPVTVTVYTGNLKPQFNETAYQAKVQETNQADQT